MTVQFLKKKGKKEKRRCNTFISSVASEEGLWRATEQQTSDTTRLFFCSVAESARLCGPVDYRPPGSSVQGILQARILAWVAISFFRGSSRFRD